MTQKNRLGWPLLVAAALTILAVSSWNRSSTAQNLGRASKDKGAFEPLLTRHGSKGMLLEVHIRVAGPHLDKVEVLGKVVQSTDAFLILKAQNQRDLQFIPWEYVLWITGRPN